MQGFIVDNIDGTGLQSWWHNIYDILTVVLGQELPDGAASIVDQAFALAVASAGLAAFALVLALVEQVSGLIDYIFFAVGAWDSGSRCQMGLPPLWTKPLLWPWPRPGWLPLPLYRPWSSRSAMIGAVRMPKVLLHLGMSLCCGCSCT